MIKRSREELGFRKKYDLNPPFFICLPILDIAHFLLD